MAGTSYKEGKQLYVINVAFFFEALSHAEVVESLKS